jgi:thiamine pyrophosphate-dependent acetolactate synthase large subunit-like protein
MSVQKPKSPGSTATWALDADWWLVFASPVKLIVLKNDSLAFVELEMKAGGIIEFGTDLHNPDFTRIAEGAGLLGLRAETPDQ